MSVYKRFFRVTEGPFVSRIDQIFSERDEASKLYEALCKDIGASSAHAGNVFAGFKFKPPGPNDPKNWKLSGSLWLPKKTTKAGKALQARIDSLPLPAQVQSALLAADLHSGPALVEGNRWYGSTLYGAAGIWFVCVPWRDEDPEKLEKYRNDRSAGIWMDGCLYHLLWSPPAEFVEVKRWQVEKEYEEITGKAA